MRKSGLIHRLTGKVIMGVHAWWQEEVKDLLRMDESKGGNQDGVLTIRYGWPTMKERRASREEDEDVHSRTMKERRTRIAGTMMQLPPRSCDG